MSYVQNQLEGKSLDLIQMQRKSGGDLDSLFTLVDFMHIKASELLTPPYRWCP